jgi:hypothetical protein
MAETVLLIVSAANPWDKFGHGTVAYEPWHNPRDGKWYMRCDRIAGGEFLLRAGCILAPDQDADK